MGTPDQRHALAKVPEATVFFWLIKILTTGMGETMSDYLVTHLNPIMAVALAGLVLVAALAWQFSLRRYVAWVYWFAVIMVSVFGTMAADILHVGLGIPYAVSTGVFTGLLAGIFIVWYMTEKTLSVHSIFTRRRELFYWSTVLTTFALGTAVGDLAATTMRLGYFSSGILFAVLMLVPALAFWKDKLTSVAAFWIAYILTRPLSVSHNRGGLGFGTGPVSFVLLAVIICLVSYLAVSQKDVEKQPATQ